MMVRYFLQFFLALVIIPLFGQDNLISNNPDFQENVSGWTTSGNATLSHVLDGALTTGAARLLVNQTNGNISSTQLNSAYFPISADLKGEMTYLSFYAKGDSDKEFRVRVELKDGAGNVDSQQSPYIQLSSTFQEHSMPVYLPEDVESCRIRFQCGLKSGSYFFDDLSMFVSTVETSDIQQFDHWVSRSFVRPALFEEKILDTGVADIQISLHTGTTLAPVLPTQFGVNSNFRSTNSLLDRTPLYEGMGAFRFPAGSGSNKNFWD